MATGQPKAPFLSSKALNLTAAVCNEASCNVCTQGKCGFHRQWPSAAIARLDSTLDNDMLRPIAVIHGPPLQKKLKIASAGCLSFSASPICLQLL